MMDTFQIFFLGNLLLKMLLEPVKTIGGFPGHSFTVVSLYIQKIIIINGDHRQHMVISKTNCFDTKVLRLSLFIAK